MATEINIKIPTNPMTMLAEGSNEFAVLASIIVRPTGTVSNGTPIVWEILDNASNHGYSFFRSAIGQATQALRIKYPAVKSVISMVVVGDESYQKQMVSFGASVGIGQADIFATRPVAQGIRLTGNGTNFTQTGDNTLTVNTISSGVISFNLNNNSTGYDVNAVVFQYVGSNNYRIRRKLSGITGTAGTAIELVDIASNAVVTTAPTSDDVIIITNLGSDKINVNLNAWGNPASLAAKQRTNVFMSAAGHNLWNIGMFELWMKASPISTTEIKVKWQSKGAVTTYKLMRSTAFTVDANGDYVLTTPLEVYSGTELSVIDEGLTTNTMYYYQLLDQDDTEITQFNTKTL